MDDGYLCEWAAYLSAKYLPDGHGQRVANSDGLWRTNASSLISIGFLAAATAERLPTTFAFHTSFASVAGKSVQVPHADDLMPVNLTRWCNFYAFNYHFVVPFDHHFFQRTALLMTILMGDNEGRCNNQLTFLTS